MGRFSPQVLPEVARYVPPIDLMGAARSIADGIDDRRQRKDRMARDQEEQDRYYDQRNQQQIDRIESKQRVAAQDKIAAGDRQRRREGDYLDDTRKAGELGYVGDAQRAQTARTGASMAAGSRALGGAAGLAGGGIGDALAAVDDAGGRTVTLTRPDDTTETLGYDPTQTKDARDEAQWMGRQRYTDSLRPEPRDPVAEELTKYEGRLKIDQKYKINDFAPRAPRGGGGGSGGGDAAIKGKITAANTQFDNANSVAARLEREEPLAPNFSKWKGGEVPSAEFNSPAGEIEAWKRDSTAMDRNFQKKHGEWQGRHSAAARLAQDWQMKGDSLARIQLGASGGAAIGDGQRVNAARAITELQQRVNAKLAEIGDDKIAQDKVRAWYAAQVQSINASYGIRPSPEE